MAKKKMMKKQYNKAHAVMLGAAIIIMTIVSASLVIAAVNQRNSCNDTDGGIIPSILGTTSGYLKNKAFTHTDFCADASNIKEYYCSGTTEGSMQMSCGTDSYAARYCSGTSVYEDYKDYFCKSGACGQTSTPQFVQDCSLMSGYVGSNYCMGGSVYKDYKNYYCNSGACTYSTTQTLQQACQFGCTNGVCNPAANSCADSDNGYAPLIQGTVSGIMSGYPYSQTDFCMDSTKLVEYVCLSPTSGYMPYNITCTGNYTGCGNGACY
jgi:hypothetical protein